MRLSNCSYRLVSKFLKVIYKKVEKDMQTLSVKNKQQFKRLKSRDPS